MPVFCYRDGDTLIERFVPAGKKPPLAVRIPGTKKFARRSIGDEQGAVMSGKSTGWPMASQSMSVLPHQIEKAKREAAEAGIKVEFKADGRPIMENPGHRNRYMKFRGVRDLDAYY